MRCPFLSEETVRFCLVAPYRKLLPVTAIAAGAERCTSAAFKLCSQAKKSLDHELEGDRCPLVAESLVQFCTASAVHTYVPWSDAQGTRCRGTGHRYCNAYLELSAPGSAARTEPRQTSQATSDETPSPQVEPELAYTDNHLWTDERDDDVHVGIDDFAADVLGSVERVSFPAGTGRRKPIVVLTVGGVDLTLVYPAALEVTRCNLHLRAHPEDLTREPYGAGWLFEARRVADWKPPRLRRGAEAASWLRDERRRLTSFVQASMGRAADAALAGDGGEPAAGLARTLDRVGLLNLFTEFFCA
jgi:glycine cleavage system H lipoate-binding protein